MYVVESVGSVMSCAAVSKYQRPSYRRNHGDPVPRGPVADFSAGSKRGLRRAVFSFPWDDMRRRVGMLTLTWPAPWPESGPEMATARRRFLDRWESKWGFRAEGLWKREFGEENGSPHLHLVIGLPREMSESGIQGWCVRTWYEVIGVWDGLTTIQRHQRQRAGVGANLSTGRYGAASSGLEAAEYLLQDLGKKRQGELPVGFRNPGRWWARLGKRAVPVQEELCCAGRYIQFRRMVRAFDDRRQRARWDHTKRLRLMAVQAGLPVSPNRGFGRRAGGETMKLGSPTEAEWAAGQRLPHLLAGGRGSFSRCNEENVKGSWTVAEQAASVTARLVRWTEQFCTCGDVSLRGA